MRRKRRRQICLHRRRRVGRRRRILIHCRRVRRRRLGAIIQTVPCSIGILAEVFSVSTFVDLEIDILECDVGAGHAEGQMILMGGRDSPSVTSPYQLLKVMLWYSMPSPAMVSMLLQAESRSAAYALLWPVHLVSIKLSQDLSGVFLWYTHEVVKYNVRCLATSAVAFYHHHLV
jgi:hypothetical protein